MQIRHGATGGVGKVLPGNKVELAVMKGNATEFTCQGTFSPSCDNITWTSSAASKGDKGCYGASWCRAWSPGCDSPEPPYGAGFAFLSSLSSNMVRGAFHQRGVA